MEVIPSLQRTDDVTMARQIACFSGQALYMKAWGSLFQGMECLGAFFPAISSKESSVLSVKTFVMLISRNYYFCISFLYLNYKFKVVLKLI